MYSYKLHNASNGWWYTLHLNNGDPRIISPVYPTRAEATQRAETIISTLPKPQNQNLKKKQVAA
ncbi:hypothetical protein [Kiloniella sp.]|uniref:hypothetical protein n=1 Tax=Kiloniella sp. TaxID=1938587 RepID=UPI003B011A89